MARPRSLDQRVPGWRQRAPTPCCYTSIDDEKSIKAFVEEALRLVDWKMQAEGYETQGRTW
jgi:hypothetical protein